MSINFSQTTALIDRNCKSNSISYPLVDKTADINLALDKALAIIFKASNRWQYDDSNHTDYPIITTDLVSGQRDYSFVADGNGNLILDIYKVLIKGPDGIYIDITPVDQQSDNYVEGFYNGLNTTGTPSEYDKTANGIFLNAIPDYNAIDGLKIYINREGSYFTISDTTKKAGFAGIFHEYLALRPSYMYAYRNGLPNTNLLRDEMLKMEEDIRSYYSDRSKDEELRLEANKINSI